MVEKMIKKKKIPKDKLISIRLPKACDESVRRIAHDENKKAAEVYRKAVEDLIRDNTPNR